MAEEREAEYKSALQACIANYVLLAKSRSLWEESPEEEDLSAFYRFQILEQEQWIGQKEREAEKEGRPCAFGLAARSYGLEGLGRFALLYLYLSPESPEECGIHPAPAKKGMPVGISGFLQEIRRLYRMAHPEAEEGTEAAAAALRPLCSCMPAREEPAACFGENGLSLKGYVYDFLDGCLLLSGELDKMLRIAEPSGSLEPMCIRGTYLDKLIRLYRQEGMCVNLYGQEGSGRRFLVRHLGKALNRQIFFLEAGELLLYTVRDIYELLEELLFFIKMRNAVLCLTIPGRYTEADEKGVDEKDRVKRRLLLDFVIRNVPACIFLTHDKMEFPINTEQKRVCMELPPLTGKEKRSLWEECMGAFRFDGQPDLSGYANKYIFSAGEIRQVTRTAACLASLREEGDVKIRHEDLLAAIKQETRNVFGGYAVRIRSGFTFEDLVVSDSAGKQMRLICDQIRYRDIVGEEWGFFRKFPYGRGISVLFYGAPGTGKTMAAQVLSCELGLDLYRIDSSQLISKYIGETEKNISDLFRKAKSLNAILFFDEADALFARRSEITDAHDRNANAETAHLLQKFEEYDGIVILATNYLNNLDPAFRRRIRFMIGFEMPSVEMRRLLWEKNLPKQAVTDEEINNGYFAERYELSGSDIKEILMNAAFLAVSENMGICNRHIEEMLWLNYRKKGKLLSREECLYLK